MIVNYIKDVMNNGHSDNIVIKNNEVIDNNPTRAH